jgi:hypothetical protein
MRTKPRASNILIYLDALGLRVNAILFSRRVNAILFSLRVSVSRSQSPGKCNSLNISLSRRNALLKKPTLERQKKTALERQKKNALLKKPTLERQKKNALLKKPTLERQKNRVRALGTLFYFLRTKL